MGIRNVLDVRPVDRSSDLTTPHGDQKPIFAAPALTPYVQNSLPLMGIRNTTPVTNFRKYILCSLPLMGIRNNFRWE